MKKIYNISSKRKKNLFGSLSLTLTIILINVFAFILFTILIGLKIPLDYIALKPFNILQGKYLWTFVTSMFMHGSFFHIFANMFSLFFVGSLIEKILGRKRYFNFYMIAGLVAGAFFVLSSLFSPANFNAFAVGASGALFGLIGLLVLLTPNLPVFIMFIPIPIKMKYAGPGILIALWLISIAGDIPIGNTAHFGGLVAGIVYGLYLKKKYKKKTKYISKYFS